MLKCLPWEALAATAFRLNETRSNKLEKQSRNAFQRGLITVLMKIQIIAVLIVLGLMQVHANSFGQNINLKSRGTNLERVIKEIEKQSGYYFFYKKDDVSAVKKVDMEFNNVPFKQALSLLLAQTNLHYDFFDQSVVIKKKDTQPQTSPSAIQQKLFTGTIIDPDKKPLAGASIRSKSYPASAITTREDGTFSIPLMSSNEVFIISFIGFQTVEFVYNATNTPASITLKPAKYSLDEVTVSSGIINRNKESFTGAVVTFSGSELKQIGNTNIIQSLKALDPSFILMENNLMGSNPNALPQLEVRGKTSVPGQSLNDQFGLDPNQPIFILNGFETSLRTIVDLDINRILSVSILKDAASTAIYGARASNGVIIVETIRPKAGPLRLSYSNDMNFEVPDLSVYNMMNAAEKLEFERLAGRYNHATPAFQLLFDELYNKHLEAVKRGVNTYWLNEPLRDIGFSNNASLYAEGGAEAFTYGANFNYKVQNGVMKGSQRDSWGANINIRYQKNNFFFDNETFIRGYQAAESPYGNFANWVNTNPYFEKNYQDRILEESFNTLGQYNYIINPIWDAQLYSFDKSRMVDVQNNLRLNYKFSPNLAWVTGLQVIKGFTSAETFKDPRAFDFIQVAELQKGTYSSARLDNNAYNFNTLLTFNRNFNERHNLTTNFRLEATQQKRLSFTTEAEGFPEGSDGNPRYAYAYKSNSKPQAGTNTYRTLNALLALNYAYDSRYLFDFSYRVDGSTAFGSENQYAPFWSTGIGWNLHNESFFREHPWINKLKLMANVGITGNQNYGTISSFRVYDYGSNLYYNQFGESMVLYNIGYPGLKPQVTKQYNYGIDFSIFNRRLNAWVNYYHKNTDPLVVLGKLPSSSGVPASPFNTGSLKVKGIEARAEFIIKQTLDNSFIWKVNATANHYKDYYANFKGSLATANLEQANDKTLIRYEDGYRPSDLWAMKSMGIDPLTGREVFLGQDGQYTFDANSAVVSAVGNGSPTFESVFSTSVFFKGFNFGVYFRWRTGADIFNSALYNKVENISFNSILNNQDKRALYARWKNPGDNASFVAIQQSNHQSNPSSRFVQRENSLSGESINLGYTFSEQAWLKPLKLRSLNVTGYLNEFFRASTVLRERGINYPFARSGSLSIRASF